MFSSVTLAVVFMLIASYAAGLKELRLLGLQPMTGNAWSGGWACLVPIKMAIEGINAHPNLLPGYNLTYEYIDNEVCLSFTLSLYST